MSGLTHLTFAMLNKPTPFFVVVKRKLIYVTNFTHESIQIFLHDIYDYFAIFVGQIALLKILLDL
jgi:hypothetical protein